jgi:hypothetical protein
MKKMMMMVLMGIMLSTTAVFAQSNTVSGKMDIDFQTRVQTDDAGSPLPGVKNIYTIDIMVTDLLNFQGKVEELPGIYSAGLGTEKQAAQINYNLLASIVNPANKLQKKAVGKFVGGVPIDKKGVYQYGRGTFRMAIDSSGAAAGFESKFSGTAAGRPPKTGSFVEKVKKEALTLSKQVKGKTVKIVVTDYDKMVYSDLTLAAGPVKSYPETRVNGEMLFDYERSAWYFNGVTMSYRMNGKDITDRLSGHIKWVEDPQRKSNGQAEYQFDVRVNEPEKSNEAAVFQGGDDEAAFFEADNTLAALVGTAKYKDQLKDGIPLKSAIDLMLTGNNLTKQQIVVLTKLILFVNIVPMSSE